jgi:hypothetical protein
LFQGVLDFLVGGDALLGGFLYQHFTADQGFLDHLAQLRRIRLALGCSLFDSGFHLGRWDRFAVHGSNILGESRVCSNCDQGQQQGGWFEFH